MNILKAVFGGRGKSKDLVVAAHASIMEQALRPEFFGPGRVDDTFAGRFESTALHASLALRRLRELGPVGQSFAQELFEEIFSGFDDALREIGTGDLRVGKKIRRIGEAFYGRALAYDSALEAGAPDESLADAIARNMTVSDGAADAIAAYVRATAASLSAQSEDTLLAAKFDWRPVELSL